VTGRRRAAARAGRAGVAAAGATACEITNDRVQGDGGARRLRPRQHPGQHPEAQLDASSSAGCERTFIDQASGTLARRPALDEALSCCASTTTTSTCAGDRPRAGRRRGHPQAATSTPAAYLCHRLTRRGRERAGQERRRPPLPDRHARRVQGPGSRASRPAAVPGQEGAPAVRRVRRHRPPTPLHRPVLGTARRRQDPVRLAVRRHRRLAAVAARPRHRHDPDAGPVPATVLSARTALWTPTVTATATQPPVSPLRQHVQRSADRAV
jgi:hypothetical protein